MVIQINFNDTSAMTEHTLIHGGPNAGKTFVLGSALKAAQLAGLSVAYINVKGEDGYRTLMQFDIEGDFAYTVESTSDFLQAIKEIGPRDVYGVDSVKFIWSHAITEVAGVGEIPKSGGNNNDWSKIHKKAETCLQAVLSAAGRVVAVCPSDRSTDQVRGGIWVTPDLPGRWAAGIAGLFDYVGYLQANTGGGQTQRHLHFEPMQDAITKVRSGKQWKQRIQLKSGLEVWDQVTKEIKAHE